jgi:hypothetical protein
MPSVGWVDKQKKLGLIPKLSGACVVVVGADATTTALRSATSGSLISLLRELT